MLRITMQNHSEATVLKLEGRLVGLWVDELERVWNAVAAEPLGKYRIVDLCGVTFVDAEGRKLLERMYAQGAWLKASGCAMNSLVEEIERDYDRSH